MIIYSTVRSNAKRVVPPPSESLAHAYPHCTRAPGARLHVDARVPVWFQPLLCAARCRLWQVGFLSDDRRTNVAITRARRMAVCAPQRCCANLLALPYSGGCRLQLLVGDSETLSAHPFLKSLVACALSFRRVDRRWPIGPVRRYVHAHGVVLSALEFVDDSVGHSACTAGALHRRLRFVEPFVAFRLSLCCRRTCA